ncbi:MAG: hypothetical protein PGN09_06370 [Sphingomonas fennica]
MAALHVGIEPVLLALLVENGAVAPADVGWVMGAGQIGMTGGAMLCWAVSGAAGRPAAIAAAALALAASIGLALAPSPAAAMVARALLGAGMGLLLARANAAAARDRPHRAIGTIVLLQQLLASVVMVVLPVMAAWRDARFALAALAVVPLIAGGLLLSAPARRAPTVTPLPPDPAPPGGAMTAHLIALAMMLVPTVMIWSYLGLAGTAAGLDAHAAELAIAGASLASIPAGLIAALRPPRQAAARTTAICGVAMLAPMLLPPGGGLLPYLAAMAAFNAGTTIATIRLGGWAMAGCGTARERRLVTLGQCAAMAAGGPFGALAIRGGGLPGLTALAMMAVAGAVVLLMPLRAGRARRFSRA